LEQSSRALSEPWWSWQRLSGLSGEILLWAMGFFCGFFGAFLLIAPHHFQTSRYEGLLPFATAWGTLALVSGGGLLMVAVVRPARRMSFAAHLLVGLALFALAASFAAVKAVTGCLAYAIFGAGTILAGLQTRKPRVTPEGGDLFSFLLGLVGAASGLLMLVLPGLFRTSLYAPYQESLPPLGVPLTAAGLLLAGIQLAPSGRDRWAWAARLFCGSSLFLLGLLISVPGLVWTGIAFYCGGGLAVIFLPALRRGLAALDTSALRTRLALALALATSLALILATAVVTAQEERLAREQVQETQKREAKSIAQNISDYIEMNGARTATMAAFAARAAMSGESQEEVLGTLRRVYGDVVALRVVSPDGRVMAASGAATIPPAELRKHAVAVIRNPSRIQLTPLQAGGRSLLLLGTPIHGDEGIQGAMVAAFDALALERRIARHGSYVSVADGRGHPIVSRDELRFKGSLPPLPEGWDLELANGGRIDREEGLVGFSTVRGLGWVVAVERSPEDALAGVRQGRDLAFGLLLLVVPLAVLAGIFAARRIARPLVDLSGAVGAMTAGNLAAPLGAGSTITEVSRLAAAFQEMRDRLAERTRESERLNAELRARAAALAESDRRKDEFLAMLAHELRNPLGAVANASYLLEQLTPPDPQLERPIAIIRRQIQHLVRMVDDLLDVSRITRGKVELRRQPVDLAEVLRHAVETARPLAEAREQTLRAEIPPEPLPLEGDATRLEQVFSNLLRNAVKFTEPGGRIELSAELQGATEAVVRVRDDGVGIPADLLPRVFDLFTQGDQGLDRTGGGLGIGLTLVRSLVEMHGGRVEASSEGPGRGSEFEVRLPIDA
jgi:signal transduction histidine kinase